MPGGFRVNAGVTEVFRTDGEGAAAIENAISEASSRIYMRTGDLVAIELAPRKALCVREDGNVEVTGFFGDKQVLGFHIIVE